MHNVGQVDAVHVALGIRYYVAAAVLVFLAAHLAFLPASLEDLDSVNFALGVRRFDVSQHRPHPPGYPLYIAAGKVVHAALPDEAKALGFISALAGGLGVLALVALFARIDPAWSGRGPIVAALLAATSPLYWLTAVRPLSDSLGLTVSIAIQALALSAVTERRVSVASGLAALAIGIRSQVAWLTVPTLLYALLRLRSDLRLRAAAGALAAFGAGVLVWAVPLVVLTGGPSAYWHALFSQGAEDLTGIQMLWTRPTPIQLIVALYYAFVAPWGAWQVAEIMVIAAGIGVVVMSWRSRPVLGVLAVAFGPYFVFDLLFQETFTTRYALPLVPPVAYLAARAFAFVGGGLGRRFSQRPERLPIPGSACPGSIVAVGFALVNLVIATFTVHSYSSTAAPAFRLLYDMRTTALSARDAAPKPVLAMHRREDLDMRRPLEWAGAAVPPFSRRLAAPPKHEWLELVKYWNGGGRDVVWFVADPMRTDLALVDRSAARSRAYTWGLAYPQLIGGVRPNEMQWLVFDPPGWYLGEGWSLTPETAGVALEDHRGPAVTGIEGWIRRTRDPVTMMIGGRNLAAGGPSARVTMAIDGRPFDSLDVAPGFFLRMHELPPGTLDGTGDYARLLVTADQPALAIEQFDAQPMGRLVFGFGDGWHEHEYNPATGRTWRWVSERSLTRVRGIGRPVRLTLRGETETFSRPSQIVVRIGDRIVAQSMADPTFSILAEIPGDLLPVGETSLAIESDQFFVPAERSRRSQDRRHLALRVYEVQLTPVS